MSIGRICSVVIAASVMLASLPVANAETAQAPTTSITAKPSDNTPRAGQVFVVRGRFLVGGSVAAGHTVRMQTHVDGAWRNIAGAKVTTTSTGTYRLRLILSIRGVRDLRAVGVTGDALRHAFHRFVVQVR